MPKSRGKLEFADARRSPVELPVDMVIGRAAGSRLRLYEAGVADKHAQITVDDQGAVWITDLGSPQGTLRNGARVEGKQLLADGDQIALGPTVLIFRAAPAEPKPAAAPPPGPVAARPAPAPVAAKPVAPAAKIAAGDRTMVPQELPAEVKAFIKAREEAEAARKAQGPGVSVGKVEPEPTDHRTVQMDSGEIDRLMKAQGLSAPAPSPQAAAKGTLQMDAAAIEAQLVSEHVIAPTSESGSKATTQMDADEVNRLWAEEQLRSRLDKPGATPAPAAKPTPAPAPAPVSAKPLATAPTMMAQAPIKPTPPAPQRPATAPTMMGQAPVIKPPPSTPATPTPAAPKPPATAPTMMAQAPVVKPTPPVTPPGARPPMPAPPAAPVMTMEMQAVTAPQPGFVSGLATTAEFETPPAQGGMPRPTGQGFPTEQARRSSPNVTPTGIVQSPSPTGRARVQSPDVTPTDVVDPLPAPSQRPMQPGVPQFHQQQPAPAPAPAPMPMAMPVAAPQQNSGMPQPAMPQQPAQAKPYVAPKKGSFGSFSRAFEFMGQMFKLAGENKLIIRPLILDLIITTVMSIGISALLFFVHSAGAAYAVLAAGTALLYFTDYACNALTASIIYDHVTTGNANMASATARVKKSVSGIMVFAAVSALLDVASTYARERRDVVARILLDILRKIWTTATYVIMPAMVIEGVPFGAAFKRSKELMAQDPTGVGAGVVAMYLTSTIASLVIFPTAYFALRFLSIYVHPVAGAIVFFLLVNLYWSVSGWMKISYATCFYLWARECERNKSQDHALAPLPLRAAIDAG
jgi:hypothetical protein